MPDGTKCWLIFELFLFRLPYESRSIKNMVKLNKNQTPNMSLDTWKTAHFGGYDRILVSKDTLDHTSNYKKRMRPACVAGPSRN